MSEGESLERLGPYFEHTGSLTWECLACRADGIEPFQITTRGYENPRSSDYEEVLSRAEAEHAVGCKGRLVFVCAGRNKMVRFDCHAELGLTLYGKSRNLLKVLAQKIGRALAWCLSSYRGEDVS